MGYACQDTRNWWVLMGAWTRKHCFGGPETLFFYGQTGFYINQMGQKHVLGPQNVFFDLRDLYGPKVPPTRQF